MIKPYTFISLSLRLSLPLPSKLGSTIPRLYGRPLGILFLQVVVIIRIAPQCKKTGCKPRIEQNKDRSPIFHKMFLEIGIKFEKFHLMVRKGNVENRKKSLRLRLVFLLTLLSCSSRLLRALQQNRALSRLLYMVQHDVYSIMRRNLVKI